jgi:hypothetical protein
VIVSGAFAGRIVKVKALEGPPPGAGLRTATLAGTTEAISPAAIEVVNRVALTKVVCRLEPFQVTTESAVNFEPVTVRVKPLPAAVAEFGVIPARTGTGLLMRRPKSLVPEPGVGWVLSLTRRVKVKSPAVAGVPLKTPVPEVNVIPGGSRPDATDQT